MSSNRAAEAVGYPPGNGIAVGVAAAFVLLVLTARDDRWTPMQRRPLPSPA